LLGDENACLLESLDVLRGREAEEHSAKGVAIEAMFVELESGDVADCFFAIVVVCLLNVSGFAKSRVDFDAEHFGKRLDVIEETTGWLKGLHVYFFSLD